MPVVANASGTFRVPAPQALCAVSTFRVVVAISVIQRGLAVLLQYCPEPGLEMDDWLVNHEKEIRPIPGIVGALK